METPNVLYLTTVITFHCKHRAGLYTYVKTAALLGRRFKLRWACTSPRGGPTLVVSLREVYKMTCQFRASRFQSPWSLGPPVSFTASMMLLAGEDLVYCDGGTDLLFNDSQ